MQQILAVVEGNESDLGVIGRAKMMAAHTGGEVSLFMSVYDPVEELNRYVGFDNYAEVKEAVMEDAEIKLRHLAEREGETLNSNMVWGRRWHLNVLTEAKNIGAELIVKAVGKHSRIAEFLQTPEDWHLLREAECPVWMVNGDTSQIDKVAASFSVLDETAEHRLLGSRVVDMARQMAWALKVPLEVVTVIPDLNSSQAAASRVPLLLGDVQARARARAEKLLADELERLGISPDCAVVLEGHPHMALADAAGCSGLLVIGSVAHRGISGKLIGNTSEKVLHHLAGDVVVVH